MPRLNRYQILSNSKSLILKQLEESDKKIYTVKDIDNFLSKLKAFNLACNITTRQNLIDFLIKNDIIMPTCFNFKNKSNIYRYTLTKNNISLFEISLSINLKSYLSHYSAMFINELTDNVPKVIYTNVEQSIKNVNKNNSILQQENIDNAFSKPMRKTNNIANIDNSIYSVHFLNGKNVNNIGVIEVDYNNSKIKVTNLERTLIDISVRPGYAGGIQEVLNAYIEAKNRVSTNKLIAILKKMNYIYPYHQVIGFYMEKAGYNENSLRLLEKIEINNDFYLTYQIKNKAYSSRWHLFFPKEFD